MEITRKHIIKANAAFFYQRKALDGRRVAFLLQGRARHGPRDALFLTRKARRGRRDALFLTRKARHGDRDALPRKVCHGPREARLAPKFKHYIRQIMVSLATFLLLDTSLFTSMSCTSMFSEFAGLHVVHENGCVPSNSAEINSMLDKVG